MDVCVYMCVCRCICMCVINPKWIKFYSLQFWVDLKMSMACTYIEYLLYTWQWYYWWMSHFQVRSTDLAVNLITRAPTMLWMFQWIPLQCQQQTPYMDGFACD